MIYVYDKIICDDLIESFNPDHVPNPVVRVVDVEGAIDIAAQIQNDDITFPIVVVNRNPDTPIDNDRMNFTRLHKGVATVLDPETNNLYYEKVVPIQLRYALTVLATNTADVDELVRELIFKYTDMYFLTFTVPYESKRKVRIGVVLDSDSNIERQSGQLDYIQSGKLYQAIVPLKVEGAVLLNYTPAHLRRTEYHIVAEPKTTP